MKKQEILESIIKKIDQHGQKALDEIEARVLKIMKELEGKK
jgi:hypothetical protein